MSRLLLATLVLCGVTGLVVSVRVFIDLFQHPEHIEQLDEILPLEQILGYFYLVLIPIGLLFIGFGLRATGTTLGLPAVNEAGHGLIAVLTLAKVVYYMQWQRQVG